MFAGGALERKARASLGHAAQGAGPAGRPCSPLGGHLIPSTVALFTLPVKPIIVSKRAKILCHSCEAEKVLERLCCDLLRTAVHLLGTVGLLLLCVLSCSELSKPSPYPRAWPQSWARAPSLHRPLESCRPQPPEAVSLRGRSGEVSVPLDLGDLGVEGRCRLGKFCCNNSHDCPLCFV